MNLNLDLLQGWIRDAQASVVRTVLDLPDGAYFRPSGLPGWQIAHVLTHLARNGDAIRTLMLAGRTGTVLSMYASREVRSEDIRVGAFRTVTAIRSDFLASMQRFEIEMMAMPPEGWERTVDYESRFGFEGRFPVLHFLLMRLFELEAHHVDLLQRYTFFDSPVAYRRLFLELAAATLSARTHPFCFRSTDTNQELTVGTATPQAYVIGASDDLIGWLSGRADGSGLTVLHGQPLPWLPPFA